MKTLQPSRGIVYVAWGDSFLKEAAASARQVRRHMALPIVLITSQHTQHAAAFDDVVIVPFSNTYRDKILMNKSPFEQTIFLDTDTFVMEPLDQIFELLQRFDVVYQASAPSDHYKLEGVPMLAFDEPSAGLIAWRNSKQVSEFFDLWHSEYLEQQRANGSGAWDQRSLRSALWHSNLKIFPLNRDWQLYSFEAGIAMNKVRMVHGRGRQAREAIAACNRYIGPRLYLPGLGFFRTLNTLPTDYLSLSARALFLFAKRSLRLSLHKLGVWKLPKNTRPS